MPQTLFITGAGRGIALALTKILLERGDTAVGACRNPDKPGPFLDLRKRFPQTLIPVVLDVNSDASAENAARETSKRVDSLDVLANIAGILPQPHDTPLEKLDFQQMRDAFETNVIGQLRVLRVLLPLLKKGKNPRVVNISSGVGSMERTDNPHFYAYGPSKAGVNKISRTLSFALKKDGITVVALDPGWVKTDMGGPAAHLTPEESASAIAATINKLDMNFSGKFIYNDGSPLPW
jgi:NAD(P)-dependent dehydrogenase (short-subunit alcohol dehydrogenase family)